MTPACGARLRNTPLLTFPLGGMSLAATQGMEVGRSRHQQERLGVHRQIGEWTMMMLLL